MPKVILSTDTLDQLDNGKISAAFRKELQRVAQDLMDRPGDKSVREVHMTMRIAPVANDAGVCEEANVEIEIKSKVPPRRSRVYSMGVTPAAKGQIMFNPASDENINQKSLDEANEQ